MLEQQEQLARLNDNMERLIEQFSIIDNSASERALRTFCCGKKSWVLINSIRGADASAIIYSITETAKLNGLNPYYYLEHLLTVMPNILSPKKEDEPQKMPDRSELEKLLPWSKDLPEKCRVKRHGKTMKEK